MLLLHSRERESNFLLQDDLSRKQDYKHYISMISKLSEAFEFLEPYIPKACEGLKQEVELQLECIASLHKRALNDAEQSILADHDANRADRLMHALNQLDFMCAVCIDLCQLPTADGIDKSLHEQCIKTMDLMVQHFPAEQDSLAAMTLAADADTAQAISDAMAAFAQPSHEIR